MKTDYLLIKLIFSKAFKLLVKVIIILTLSLPPVLTPLAPVEVAYAHNLDQRNVHIAFDPNTLDMWASRAAGGSNLVQAGDVLGIVLKSTPGPGTLTGVGGYMTFYIPPGTQVVGADYVRPDSSGGYVSIPIKGQSIIAIGDGSIGSKTTSQLVGLTLGPNINGVTAQAVDSTGLHNGTIAGVYADTGIFYSTDSRTIYNSWVDSGGYDGNPGTADNQITNNRGETITPVNSWDAEQLLAFGSKSPAGPIVDYGDGRGNAPWGMGSTVAGPQSGYAWNFDRSIWQATNNMIAASSSVGPWKRIQYPGSQISDDTPGLKSTVLGYAGVDGSTVGYELSESNPLPVSTTAVRFSYGMLELGRSEYARVFLKILNPGDGCFTVFTDAFGGDAGGEQGGKDHLWRYYDPTVQSLNTCAGIQKIASDTLVKVGEIFSFEISFFNSSLTQSLTNVVIQDLIPSGLQVISAMPAQNSGPNPLIWNLGTATPNSFWKATVYVRATSTGTLENSASVTSDNTSMTTYETVYSGSTAQLNGTKSVSPDSIQPGGTVDYTLRIDNDGTGANSTPLVIHDYLPEGFSFQSMLEQRINGGLLSVSSLNVNLANPNEPVFTVSQYINPGSSLALKFRAQVDVSTPAGTYFNTYSYNFSGKTLAIPPIAPVNVGDAAVGDTIFRDWNGDGIQGPEDEGVLGVTVELLDAGNNLIATTITGENGDYLFNSLAVGTYTVRLVTGVDTPLEGYVPTYDPDGGAANQAAVSLTSGQQDLNVDFGYLPFGAGIIGDTIWKDDGSGGGAQGDGLQSGTEPGLPGVSVYLFEDTNANGIIDTTDALMVATQTDSNGNYSFSGLPFGINFLVDADETDPDFSAAFLPGETIAASTAGLIPVSPLSAEEPTNLEVDFGYYVVPPARIGDQIFIDNDADGLYTAGIDDFLAGIEVRLFVDVNANGSLDPGEMIIATTSSDINGQYDFSGLPSGSYIVDVMETDQDLPDGLSPSRDLFPVMLAPGEYRFDIDFPFTRQLIKTVDKNDAMPGETLTYSVLPSFPGGALLTNLQVTDPMPAGTTYVPGSASAGGVLNGNTLTWQLGSNTPGTAGVYVFCPQTIRVYAESDTWIREDSPSNNFGNSTTFETANESGKDRIALLRFPISSSILPAGAIFKSAAMYVTVESGQGTNRQVQVHKLLTGYTEGTGNNNACTSSGNGAAWQGPNCTDDWKSTGGNFGASDYSPVYQGTIDPVTDERTYRVDVSTSVTDWIGGGINYGLTMVGIGSATNSVKWHSRTSSSTNKRPSILITYLQPTPNECTIRTDGLSLYTVNSTQYLQNYFSGSTNTFGSGVNAFTVTSKPVTALAGAASYTRDEWLLMAVDNNSNVLGRLYNGSTWVNAVPNPLGTVSLRGYWSADVAYERLSDDALLVWADSAATPKLRYSTWNGESWSTPAGVPGYSGGEPRHMNLVAQPDSDSMALVVTDANYDDYALVWNGQTWGNIITLDATGKEANDQTNASIAYESQSKRAVVVYAKDLLSHMYYRTWDGSAWSGEGVINAPAAVTTQPQWISLASDPNSNRLGLSVLTTNKTVWLNIWSGSTWGTPVVASTGAQSSGVLNTSVAFETLSGKALAVYGEAKNVRYRTWNSAGGWSTELNGPILANNTSTMLLNSDPNSNEIMLAALDSGQDYRNVLWDGSLWGDLTTQSTDTDTAIGLPFAYLWKQNQFTQPGTNVSLVAFPTMVVNGGPVQVKVSLQSTHDGTLTDLPLVVSGVNGASAVCGDPAPALPQPITANIPLEFTFNCTVSAGVLPGSLTFATTPSGSGDGIIFSEGTSNSVLVTPLLIFQVTVDTPQTVVVVENIASFQDDSVSLPQTYSNKVITRLPGGTIGDFVWFDDNLNGAFDPGEGELAIEGAAVMLFRDLDRDGLLDADEPQIGFTRTDQDGYYTFENIPPGSYVVDIYEDSLPIPAEQLSNYRTTTGEVQAVVLTMGGAYLEADFGYFEGATAGDLVYHDVNHNGVQDPDEPGLANITVTLTGTDLSANPVNLVTETDADGIYRFLIPAGIYTISHDMGDADYPANLSMREATTPTSYEFIAKAGWEYIDFDFGIDNTGKVGDTVFVDANGNGVQGAGETGLRGVTVYMYDGSGVTLLATTVTDAMGHYLFEGLADNSYLVVVDTSSIPAGYFQTADPDQPDVTCTVCDHQGTATIVGGGTDMSMDFGYMPAVPTHSVSGTVFEDLNGDGIDNGEPPLTDVSVELAVDLDGDGEVDLTFTTVTDASGNYSVTGIPEGSNVSVSVYTSTLPNGAYAPTQPNPPVRILTNLQSDAVGQDFGFLMITASISGSVCVGNGNGDCNKAGDPSEAGQPNSTIYLTYAGSDGILGTGDDQTTTTITDMDGDYTFTGLVPGAYQLRKQSLSGIIHLADIDGSHPNDIRLVLGVGEARTNQDFEISVPTAVIVSSFTAHRSRSSILLDWVTTSELDLIGFNLYRSLNIEMSSALVLNQLPIMACSPGSLEGNSYRFVDNDVEPGITYNYWLEVITRSGRTTVLGPASAGGYAIFIPDIMK